jgi:hypothetical protein
MVQEGIQNCQARMEQNIERQIVQRTWGRVHRLRVEVKDDRVVVHGCTSSYYLKQLALEGVRDVLGGTDPAEVQLDIDVARVAPRVTNFWD